MHRHVLRRCLSWSAVVRAKEQTVRPPIQEHRLFQVHGVEGRYAAALYSAASKDKQLDAIDKDMKSLQNVYNTSLKFKVHGVEGRYAAALYSAASKDKQLDTIDKDMKSLQNVYNTSLKFKEFVLNPTLTPLIKVNTVKDIAKSLSISKGALNFLGMFWHQSYVIVF
ncbi:unnamed protein product [Gongylonema pulchrum]|uniref:Oligomycin sensitivity conferral protein n=1 Tax=Gongylonema pulchrum TaxID=637853 RepID=A0A183EGS3_9BILA|nr:unnamed protein product [Gongylonema pulchrum]